MQRSPEIQRAENEMENELEKFDQVRFRLATYIIFLFLMFETFIGIKCAIIHDQYTGTKLTIPTTANLTTTTNLTTANLTTANLTTTTNLTTTANLTTTTIDLDDVASHPLSIMLTTAFMFIMFGIVYLLSTMVTMFGYSDDNEIIPKNMMETDIKLWRFNMIIVFVIGIDTSVRYFQLSDYDTYLLNSASTEIIYMYKWIYGLTIGAIMIFPVILDM